MADAVLEHISKHTNPRVRYALMYNHLAPIKSLPPVRIYIEEGLSQIVSFAGMSQDDMECLGNASFASMRYIARRVQDIEDTKIRREVTKVLLAHPDPTIRLTLAINSAAPRYALQALCKDKDPDIAAMAKMKITKT